MAARKLRIKHSDEIRLKIQATQLINRLQAHIDGRVTLTPTQIRAIDILLRKSVPDLRRIELIGDADAPLRTVNKIELVALDGDRKDSAAS
jgi:hypothetical protein